MKLSPSLSLSYSLSLSLSLLFLSLFKPIGDRQPSILENYNVLEQMKIYLST